MSPSPIERIPPGVQAALFRSVFDLPPWVRGALAGRPVERDNQRLDRDMRLLLRLQSLEGYGGLAAATPARARAGFAAGSALTAGRRITGVSIRDLSIPTADGDIPARLYTPAGLDDGSPLLVFYHGGGWVIGNIETHDNTCRFLATRAGARVLSPDYRLAPEHPFPAAVDDAMATFDYAVERAGALGADPAAIAVGGDSAGGNLAAVVSHQTARRGGAVPVFALLLYPATDASVRRRSRELFAEGFLLTDEDMTWFADHYAPVERRTDPRVSPLLADDLSGFPPTYLATCGFDPLRDEGEEFAAKLEQAGVPVALRRHPDLIHGFASLLGTGPRCREATAEAAGALRTGFGIARAKFTTSRRTA